MGWYFWNKLRRSFQFILWKVKKERIKVKRLFILLFILTICFLGVIGYHYSDYFNKLKTYNLTYPKKRIVFVDREKYKLTIYNYRPPYSVPRDLLKDKEKADYSMPEGTNNALYSAVGRDREWYISLHDEGAREALLEQDKKTGGKILEEYNRDEPLLMPEGSYEKFLYKVEFKVDNKKYAMIEMEESINGRKFPSPAYRIFVNQKGTWLCTEDLHNHPLLAFVDSYNYEEILKVSKIDIVGLMTQSTPFIILFVLIICTIVIGTSLRKGK